MSIYVAGSIAYDRIMTFPGAFEEHLLPDQLHILNVCFLIDHVTLKRGGTAGNIAYNLALLGEKPRYIFDPGQQIPALSGAELTDALTGAFACISNDYELELLMTRTGLTEKALAGRVKWLITTLGDKGSRLIAGLDVPEAAAVGATCAGFCVEHSGTQEHTFTKRGFLARLRASFGKPGRQLFAAHKRRN